MHSITITQDLNALFGEANGYTFVLDQQRSKGLNTLIFSVGDESLGIEAFIEDYREDHPGIGAQVRFDRQRPELIVPLDLSQINMETEFYQIVEAITFELQDRGYIQRCRESSRSDDLKLCRFEASIGLYNAEVFEAMVSNYDSTHKPQSVHFKHVLGAIIGMSIGIALWILLSSMNILAGFAGYAIMYLGFKGYEKAGGTLTTKRILVIAFMSLVCVALAEYLSKAIAIQAIAVKTVSFTDILFTYLPILMRISEVFIGMATNVVIGWLLTILSSYSAINRYIAKNKHGLIAYNIKSV